MLLFASLAIGIGLCEVGLRLLGRAEPRPRYDVGELENRPSRHFVADDAIGWRMHASHSFVVETEGRPVRYTSDADGFRVSDDAAQAKHDGFAGNPVRRLVAVGDSFCFGLGVAYDETFVAHVGRSIGFAEVRNLAMPGFGLDQIFLSVREYALDLQPDLLLVALYEEDFERSMTAFRADEGFAKPAFRLARGRIEQRTIDDRRPVAERWLERHSRLFTAARRSIQRLGYRSGVGETWKLNAAILDELRSICGAANVPLLVIYIPSPRWTGIPMLRRKMQEHAVPFVDPTSFEETAPPGAYFPVDGHLNETGHARFASWIDGAIGKHFPDLYP